MTWYARYHLKSMIVPGAANTDVQYIQRVLEVFVYHWEEKNPAAGLQASSLEEHIRSWKSRSSRSKFICKAERLIAENNMYAMI
jgi:hypothetical protein